MSVPRQLVARLFLLLVLCGCVQSFNSLLPNDLCSPLYGALAWVSSSFEALSQHLCSSTPVIGRVDDCATDFQTVDTATQQYFHPIVNSLVKTKFFSFFKVNLWKPCPFWRADGYCTLEQCAVCECDEKEVPKPWRQDDQAGKCSCCSRCNKIGGAGGRGAGELGQKRASAAPAFLPASLGKVDTSHATVGRQLQGWAEPAADHVWIEEDRDEENMAYINLRKNPHGYTGYVGEDPRRLWHEVHSSNCFSSKAATSGRALKPGSVAGQCIEERVFQRLISGLQSSISTHIALRYVFDDGTVGPNTKLWVERVGRHPERLTNLYFSYLFMLRAIARGGSRLLAYNYSTSHADSDQRAHELLQQLVSEPLGHTSSCPSRGTALLAGFDETVLFRDPEEDLAWPSQHQLDLHRARRHALKGEMRARFRNISRLIDCVGCEKCRLYGKLQILGLGTALKLLFAGSAASGQQQEQQPEPLLRNEIIALINTLFEFSSSIVAAREFRVRELEQVERRLIVWLTVGMSFALAALLLCIMRRPQRRRRQQNPHVEAAALSGSSVNKQE